MIVGTAGHVDHGKSALVEAVTGQAMDPLAEERRRGITIDLHVATLALPGGGSAAIVDVPGHEELVRTMVAGASGIDLALLVIAADEGIMPQTREHLAVIEQLRIPRAIPVITKSDLTDSTRLEALSKELVDWLRPSPVRFGSPRVTSARTGAGIEELRREIAGIAGEVRARRDGDLARLPIDRAFSLPGVGPVVTGTAWSGAFRVGDHVTVLPEGDRARVRSLGRHGEDVRESAPGERTAVALNGVELSRLRRGQVLVHSADPWESSGAIDVMIELLPGAPRALAPLQRVRVHLGTSEVMARVHPRSVIPPGGSGLARLVLETPLVTRGTDRLVVRSYSPVTVIGGGWVVDPVPSAGKPVWPDGLASEEPRARLEALLARRSEGLLVAALPVLLGTPPGGAPPLDPATIERVGATLISRARLEQGRATALAAVNAYHVANPAAPGMPVETLRRTIRKLGLPGQAAVTRLVEERRLLTDEAFIRDPGFRSSAPGDDDPLEQVVRAVNLAGMSPPSIRELETTLAVTGVEGALRLAVREARIVAIGGGRYASHEALAEFAAALAAVAARGSITPGALRDVTGLTRKFLIPLLEWSDQTGLTIRRGDARVPGARLAARTAGTPR